MVIVEGVARSLDPRINIWQVAKPIVESYIKENLGPRAMLRDLLKTARVVARFGPKLPQMAEDALTRQTRDAPRVQAGSVIRPLLWVGLGVAATLGAIWLYGQL